MADFHSHKIKRLVLELQGLREEDAREIQNRIGRLYHSRILPVLDRYLTQLSPNGRQLRIEKLELDLGKVNMAKLEVEIINQIETQLRRQLSDFTPEVEEQKKERGRRDVPSESSQWELFQYFVQTGSLPWWVEGKTARPVLESLDYLIEKKPSALIAAMSEWIKRKDYLQRLLRQLPRDRLLQLAGLRIKLTPASFEASARDFFHLAARLSARMGVPASRFREEAWLKLLQIAFSQTGPITDAYSFWEEWIRQLAAVFRVKYERLVGDLQKEIAASSETLGSDLPEIVRRLLEKEFDQASSISRGNHIRTNYLQDLSSLWLKDDQLSAKEKTLLKKALMEGKWDSFSLSELKALNHILATNEQIRLELAGRWETAIKEQLAKTALPTALRRGLASWLKNLREDAWKPFEAPGLMQMLTEAGRYPASESIEEEAAAFSRGDELFIENAGLVILWPYLSRFFESLELIKDKEFVDARAAHRAAGLLQYLADGQPEPLEYLMGFNKILCGLVWSEVLDFGDPITEKEAEECDFLLQAVIANAPILKNMSPDGFRGTFLLRKGMLRSIPEAWELHVERETYDVVLDKFPWSWKVVKLPWLDRVILVEWLAG